MKVSLIILNQKLIQDRIFTIRWSQRHYRLSRSSPIDYDSQDSLTIYEKITKNIDETWIFCEIMKLIRYRLDLTDFQLTDYLKNKEEFRLLDSQQYGENPLTIGEFTQKYNIIYNRKWSYMIF